MVTIGEVCTVQGEVEFEFEWKIQNFCQLPHEPDRCYSSPEFNFCGVSWVINIYPNGARCDGSLGWIGLYLTPMSITAPVTMDYSLCFKMANGAPDMYSQLIGRDVFQRRGAGWGRPTFVRRTSFFQRKRHLLPYGNLTVICTLKNQNTDFKVGNVVESVNKFTQTEGRPQLNIISVSTSDFSKCKVLQDFKDLYLKQADCDVIIKVKGREFKTHQAILKARSPVFCSALQINMKEKATGVIKINDCDPSTFSDFLCFLYCGEVENLSAVNVFSLFTIADKYEVMDLRSQCLKFMKENLTVDTFCDTISLALLHSEAELVELSIEFFAENISKIIVTVKWQLFLEENPTKGNELLIKALVLN